MGKRDDSGKIEEVFLSGGGKSVVFNTILFRRGSMFLDMDEGEHLGGE